MSRRISLTGVSLMVVCIAALITTGMQNGAPGGPIKVKMKKLNTSRFETFGGLSSWSQTPSNEGTVPSDADAYMLFYDSSGQERGATGSQFDRLWLQRLWDDGVHGMKQFGSPNMTYFVGSGMLSVTGDPNDGAVFLTLWNTENKTLTTVSAPFDKIDSLDWAKGLFPEQKTPPPIGQDGTVDIYNDQKALHAGEIPGSKGVRANKDNAAVGVLSQSSWYEYGDNYIGANSATVRFSQSSDWASEDPHWTTNIVWKGKKQLAMIGPLQPSGPGTVIFPFAIDQYGADSGALASLKTSTAFTGSVKGKKVSKSQVVKYTQERVPAFGSLAFLAQDDGNARDQETADTTQILFYQFRNAEKTHCVLERYGGEYYFQPIKGGKKSGAPTVIPVPFWQHKQKPGAENYIRAWDEQVSNFVALGNSRHMCILTKHLYTEPRQAGNTASIPTLTYTDALLQVLVFDLAKKTVEVAATLGIPLREGDTFCQPTVFISGANYVFYVERYNQKSWLREAFTGAVSASSIH
ncbi:MAG: hypothetical protein AB1714_10740 [Acidobacteriota bacterium]